MLNGLDQNECIGTSYTSAMEEHIKVYIRIESRDSSMGPISFAGEGAMDLDRSNSNNIIYFYDDRGKSAGLQDIMPGMRDPG